MLRTRVTEMLGVAIPILQAPMSWVSRAQLVAATSEAGGFGILEAGSGDLAAMTAEVASMADRTGNPFGVNLPLNLLRNRSIEVAGYLDVVQAAGVKVLTTSAGDPRPVLPMLKARGFRVLHVVGTLAAAQRAEEAGADGLIVEGSEGGGFKQPGGASTMVLLPLVTSNTDLPVVAAGGVVDGVSMAAAFALGAEGVQMGTALVASQESPVHANYKAALVAAAETDTVLLNENTKPTIRALRTAHSLALCGQVVTLAEFDRADDLYRDGDMDASLAGAGQSVGRIDRIRPVAEILADTIAEFHATVARLAASCAATGART
ncbi:nitronate monooxygenase [Sporichthya polymorpha]|uniref:nitronate monooxygenase n=1 Tax=Sporichthya polymorpha TaxID=35751 RepID=UPI0003658AAB